MIRSRPSLPPPLLPSQVFLRESLEHRLEKQRELEVLKAAMIIQAHVLGYMARYHSVFKTFLEPALMFVLTKKSRLCN